jgi:cobalt transporter subunit CbtA
MFKNLLLVGLLAGVLSGSLLTLLQAFTVLPVIHQAEQYESQSPTLALEEGKHDHDDGDDWKPHEGWERLGFTWLANISIASGFALIMAGVMSIHRPKTWFQSILFGMAGYYAFFLAPALLLPPELPGADSPSLESRQAIWLFTVVAALAGIYLIVLMTKAWQRLLGLLSLASPFALFSLEEARYLSPVPLDLVEKFTRLALITNAIHWMVIGLLVYWLFKKMKTKTIA